MVLEWGHRRVLVDPMLSAAGRLPSFRLRRRRRNPTVGLPETAAEILAGVTDALITHCRRGHIDHLDAAGLALLVARAIPTHCTVEDAGWLAKRGVKVHAIGRVEPHVFGDGTIERVPCRHGHGWIAWFMANGSGYVVRQAQEPSIYVLGDTVLTPTVEQAIEHHRPDVIVVAAGGAQLPVGGPILMTLGEVLRVTELAPGIVVANHLEALDHCPTTRAELRNAAERRGLGHKLRIPDDGDTIALDPPE